MLRIHSFVNLIFFFRMSSMANFRGFLVLFLAALQLFIMEPAYCDWENDFTGFEERSTQKPERIPKFERIPKLAASGGNVIVVSQRPGQGGFSTIQAAINSIPARNQQPVTIQVNPGTYREKVQIPEGKSFITLIGADAQTTVLTYNDNAQNSGGTYYCATLNVLASDFVAKSITIENSFGHGDLNGQDQAVALKVSGDRSAFYNCRITGFQDTLLDDSGRHYFENCFIQGAVDFVFGNGKSIYQGCELNSIPVYYGTFTAQKRMSAAEDTGFVFLNCKLTGKGPNYLGKPWGPYSTVLFANTYMDNIIDPAGWANWDNDYYKQKTAHYGEFQCSGPGASQNRRVSWSRKVTSPRQVARYLTIDYIDGRSWLKQ